MIVLFFIPLTLHVLLNLDLKKKKIQQCVESQATEMITSNSSWRIWMRMPLTEQRTQLRNKKHKFVLCCYWRHLDFTFSFRQSWISLSQVRIAGRQLSLLMRVQGRGRGRRMAGRRWRVAEDVQVRSESDRKVHTQKADRKWKRGEKR